MTKVTVTYVAPEGDSEVVETRGVKFFNGQSKELDEKEHKDLIAKARKNPLFEIGGAKAVETEDADDDEPKPVKGKPGRKPKLSTE